MSEHCPFLIVAVCTGNVCRSPLAAALFNESEIPGLVASSAGTSALVGSTPTDTMIDAADGVAADLRTHRGRSLRRDDLLTANLVIGMAREHRSQAVALVPRVARRSFTLREIARLCGEVTDSDLESLALLSDECARLDALIALLASLRGSSEPPASAAADDVVDPYRHGDGLHRRAAQQISEATEVVLALFGRVISPGCPVTAAE